jgi:hypothetical protein
MYGMNLEKAIPYKNLNILSKLYGFHYSVPIIVNEVFLHTKI